MKLGIQELKMIASNPLLSIPHCALIIYNYIGQTKNIWDEEILKTTLISSKHEDKFNQAITIACNYFLLKQ